MARRPRLGTVPATTDISAARRIQMATEPKGIGLLYRGTALTTPSPNRGNVIRAMKRPRKDLTGQLPPSVLGGVLEARQARQELVRLRSDDREYVTTRKHPAAATASASGHSPKNENSSRSSTRDLNRTKHTSDRSSSKQNPRWTQKAIYTPIFTHYIRS